LRVRQIKFHLAHLFQKGWALGGTAQERQFAYRELFRYDLDPGVIDQIRKATNGNFVLGDNRFAEQIEEMLGRRATLGSLGGQGVMRYKRGVVLNRGLSPVIPPGIPLNRGLSPVIMEDGIKLDPYAEGNYSGLYPTSNVTGTQP
jgi:hypothetical protein